MATITSPDFPGERLILCRNAALAAERARKREDLLAATERELARIATAVARKRAPLRGKAEIGMAVGAVLDKHKMAKQASGQQRTDRPGDPRPPRGRRLPDVAVRDSTGLPCAPILGSPSPSTRAPLAFSLSRAARMSSTS